MRVIGPALSRLRQDRFGRRVAIGAFTLLLPFYATMLPAAFTGGRIGWVSLRLLTPLDAAIALALAVFLALTMAMVAMLLRDGRRASKAVAGSGAVIGLVTPLLCCSPLLPTLLAGLALVFPALANAAAGSVQGFIATHETAILSASVALTALAFWQNARRLVTGPACRTPRHN